MATEGELEGVLEDETNETDAEEGVSPAAKTGSITSPKQTSPARSAKSAEGAEKTQTPVVQQTEEGTPGTAKVFAPIPTALPPWEEWSDAFINEETWNNEVYNGEVFEDTFDTTELLQLKAFHWMRPIEFTSAPAVVKLNSSVIDIITPNAHLCENYELIRFILSEISELYEYSLENGVVECEGEGTVYIPNFAEDDRKWTPWSHIYSCCKAGVRGERPAYNPKGLYYVRLYFMGAWRRIMVDDRIPVLPSGQSGLPLTNTNDLWPLLLTKALLKIATVTWRELDVKRFSTISSLTGWIYQWVDNINGVNEDDLWTDLQNTLPKYVDPKRIPSCYTMLTPSAKKRRFGLQDENDTFWWMPANSDHPQDIDNVQFTDQETEALVQNEEAIIAQLGASDEFKSPYHIKWHRKADPEARQGSQTPFTAITRKSKGVKAVQGQPQERPQSFSDKTEREPQGANVDAAPSMLGKKSTKKKKTDTKNTAEEAVSERKLAKKEKGGKKDKDKEKEGDKEKEKEKDKEKDKKKKEKDPKEGKEVKNVKIANNGKGQDGQNEEDNKPNLLSITQKATNKWSTIKTLLLGDHSELGVDLTKIKSKGSKTEEDEDAEEGEGEEDDEQQTDAANSKPLTPSSTLPSLHEILYGVEKYAGLDYRNMVKNWQNICGKDSPITLVVVLNQFPPPDKSSSPRNSPVPQIPAYLQHPIQLVEVRDSFLQKTSDRPTTPLWKRFRWKAWAMKKGLIPMEEDHSKDRIRAIKVKTPFIFKNDWLESPHDDMLKKLNELSGEDDDTDDGFFIGLDKESVEEAETTTLQSQVTPASPPTTMSAGPTTVVQITLPQSDEPRPSLNAQTTGPSNFSKKASAISAMASMLRKSNSKLDKTETERSVADSDKGKDSQRDSPTLVIHESEIVQGESEEEFDEEYRAAISQVINIAPQSACGTVWLDCDEVAQNLRKFCKFYPSQSIFGSCYILRREANVMSPVLDKIFQDVHSDLPKHPQVIMNHKLKRDCFNYAIEFERRVTYHVTNYHLDNREGSESAFYLCMEPSSYIFSDCWTDQELIINAFMLQEEVINKFNDATLAKPDEMPGPPPTPATAHKVHAKQLSTLKPRIPPVSLVLIVEPWDWRKDCCVCEPLIRTTVTDQWIAHLRLPAGRNTFRIWIMLKDADGNCVTPDANVVDNRINCTPFSIRIVSQTPIYIGSRNETQNYMTNPPMLLLKQAERLANHIWGLFACYGKKVKEYGQNLKDLRRTYCPAYTYPNKINSFVRGAHDTFEELFVSLLAQFNDGVMDRMTLLALRVLFLNPTLGRCFVGKRAQRQREVNISALLRSFGKKTRALVPTATLTIQRYYRGWRVRRLFKMRNKHDPKFRKLEYKLRQLAYLLAKETDSIFSHPDDFQQSELGHYPRVEPNQPIDPEKVPPTMLPKPPHWALNLLSHLTDRHPWLITIYPHAHCVAHHVKIEEFEGQLPQKLKNFSWYPFCREVLKVPQDSKSCFCEIDLQVYPTIGVYLKVVNNDTGNILCQGNERRFIGRLAENKLGYTLLCYRWAIPIMGQVYNDRLPSNTWKIRLITPFLQEGPYFVDASQRGSLDMVESDLTANRLSPPISPDKASASMQPPEGQTNPLLLQTQIPKKLCLRRLTGHYIPNKDYSLCQYVLETDKSKVELSLRFRVSYEKALVRVSIWDCVGKSSIYETICQGGIILPVVVLQPQRRKKSRMSEAEADEEGEDLDDNEELADFDDFDPRKSRKSSLSSKRSNKSENEEDPADGDNMGDDENDFKGLEKKYRYIISFYTDEDSWPLLDHELLYLFYKERKFFKDVKRCYCRGYGEKMEKVMQEQKEREKVLKEQLEAEVAAAAASAAAAEEEEGADENNEGQQGESGTEYGLAAPPPPTVTPSVTIVPMHEQAPTEKKKHDDMKSKKRQTKKDKGELMEGITNKPAVQSGSVEEKLAQDATTAYPLTPPPTTVSQNAEGQPPVEEKKIREKKEEKLKRRSNGSLIMKYGGKQSQVVSHLDQPHWVLELVTDADVKYKVKSNWQLLRKRLLQMKEPWEEGGNLESLYRELSERLDFFLENLIDVNIPFDERRYAIIDPISNVFSCLRLQNYNLKGMPTNDFVELIELIWSTDPQENRKGAEKLMQIRKDKLCKSDEPTPKPSERIIDYLPKSLRKFIQRCRQQAEERAAERQMKFMTGSFDDGEGESGEEEDEEEEEEGEMVEDSAISMTQSNQNNHQQLSTSSKPDVTQVPAATVTSIPDSAKPSPTELKLEKPGALKKGKLKAKKSVGNLEGKRKGKPGGGERQESTGKSKAKDGRLSLPRSSKSVEVVEDKEDSQPSLEDECDAEIQKLKNCEVVKSIFEQYTRQFEETKPIRQVLARNLATDYKEEEEEEDDDYMKLVLTRSGISKYCGGDDASEDSKGEPKEKASMVADKLLEWTMDFICLPNAEETNEKITDFGDFPEFFLKCLIAEKPDYYLFREEVGEISREEEEVVEEEEQGSSIESQIKLRQTLNRLFSSKPFLSTT